MLVYLNQAFKKYQLRAKEKKCLLTKEDIANAVMDGALLRLRPIVMTVCAVVGGLLPGMFFGGTGSEIMSRIAEPMIGCMISATALAVIPAVYFLLKQKDFK